MTHPPDLRDSGCTLVSVSNQFSSRRTLSRRRLLQGALAAATLAGSGVAGAKGSWRLLDWDQIASPDELPDHSLAVPANTKWMLRRKYGIFVHYQYRILLGYSVRTKPQFPDPARMNAAAWNRFVDGFNVEAFAAQVAAAKAGWVIFCMDDHYFAWQCAPNKAFNKFTGYAPGDKCSRRDLIMELADALNAKGVKLIVYFAGLNGYMKEPKVRAGLMEDHAGRGDLNEKTPPSDECRRRRLAILSEYAQRYRDRIAGWWFDSIYPDTYKAESANWQSIGSIVHAANPRAVIAFSYGANEQACISKGIDGYTAGDTWSKQDLKRFTPMLLPPQDGILWHGKIYCGNIYHGMGNANQFADQELVDWIGACNRQRGVCTLDWPFEPETGLFKNFGYEQLQRVASLLEANEPALRNSKTPLPG